MFIFLVWDFIFEFLEISIERFFVGFFSSKQLALVLNAVQS